MFGSVQGGLVSCHNNVPATRHLKVVCNLSILTIAHKRRYQMPLCVVIVLQQFYWHWSKYDIEVITLVHCHHQWAPQYTVSYKPIVAQSETVFYRMLFIIESLFTTICYSKMSTVYTETHRVQSRRFDNEDSCWWQKRICRQSGVIWANCVWIFKGNSGYIVVYI